MARSLAARARRHCRRRTTDNYDVDNNGRFLPLDELPPLSRNPLFMIIRGWRELAAGE